ncbi:hypothetical protein B0H13DRAFT_1532235, partial [Mycena leptocephala]
NLATTNRHRLLKDLIRLSGDSKLYPRCFTLPNLEPEKGGTLVAGGGFGDIHTGLFGVQRVAIKVMRVFWDSDIDAVLKTFHVGDWSRSAYLTPILSPQPCPNLLPFLGLYYSHDRLALVSPWMENGHIRASLKK